MKNKMKTPVGFWLTIGAAVFALVGVIVYSTVMNTKMGCFATNAIAVVICVLGLAGTKLIGNKEIPNWAPCIAAVLIGYTMVSSASVMVDAIGYVVSGLYLFSDIQTYVIFLAVDFIALALNAAAGFLKLVE